MGLRLGCCSQSWHGKQISTLTLSSGFCIVSQNVNNTSSRGTSSSSLPSMSTDIIVIIIIIATIIVMMMLMMNRMARGFLARNRQMNGWQNRQKKSKRWGDISWLVKSPISSKRTAVYWQTLALNQTNNPCNHPTNRSAASQPTQPNHAIRPSI